MHVHRSFWKWHFDDPRDVQWKGKSVRQRKQTITIQESRISRRKGVHQKKRVYVRHCNSIPPCYWTEGDETGRTSDMRRGVQTRLSDYTIWTASPISVVLSWETLFLFHQCRSLITVSHTWWLWRFQITLQKAGKWETQLWLLASTTCTQTSQLEYKQWSDEWLRRVHEMISGIYTS